MMNLLKELFRQLIGLKIETSITLFKIKAAIAYLNLVKSVRRQTMLLCLLLLSVIVSACGFLLIPVGLCLFMPWSLETKAVVATSVGAAYIIFPLIAMTALFSERRWMKASGAAELLQEALKKNS